MGRREAREIALHLVFELSFKQFHDDELVTDRLEQSVMDSLAGDVALYAGELTETQKKYIRDTVMGICEHYQELDEAISAHSKNWNTNRLSHMTKSVLCLALYEMRYTDDVPVSTAINEAVELAKKYESKEAASFINGVLGGAARENTK